MFLPKEDSAPFLASRPSYLPASTMTPSLSSLVTAKITPPDLSTAVASSLLDNASPELKNSFAMISNALSSSSKLQGNLAMRNDIKNQLPHPSAYTPEGVHIDVLRKNRKLKRDELKANLSLKMGAETDVLNPMKHDVISITSTPSPPPTKTMNRIHNNGLNRNVYDEITQMSQHDNTNFSTPTYSDFNTPMASCTPSHNNHTSPKWEQDARIECIRKMRNGERGASNLFRLLNRKMPHETWNDILRMGDDCRHAGMTIADMVECMLQLQKDLE